METKFELKNVEITDNTEDSKEFSLKFSDGEENKTITLAGSGNLKEAVKL